MSALGQERHFERASVTSGVHPTRDISLCTLTDPLGHLRATSHDAAVVGSIIFLTSVIFVAGKSLISACLRMIAIHRFLEISVGIAVGLLLTAVWPEPEPAAA